MANMSNTDQTMSRENNVTGSQPRYGFAKTAYGFLANLVSSAGRILRPQPVTVRELPQRQSGEQRNRNDDNIEGALILPPQPIHDAYQVASASQLSGSHVEHSTGNEQPSIEPPRHLGLRNRHRAVLKAISQIFVKPKSAPTLGAVTMDEASAGQRPSTSRFSSGLSTIVEQAEPDTIRPISEVLSIGEARLGYMVRANDYELSINKFGAKASTLITEIGSSLDIYARRQMDVQSSPSFDPDLLHYFRPYLSKLFTRCCLCDINIQGDPIRLFNKEFVLSSASLEIGACWYLNVLPVRQFYTNTTTLRIEYDPLTKQCKYVVYFGTPVCNEELEMQYTLVSQVDVTDALRRLALQELNDTSEPLDISERSPISSQIHRFLAFIYWLGTHHANALIFTKQHSQQQPSAASSSSSTQPAAEWRLRFAAQQMYRVPELAISSSNSQADLEHMALAMDEDDAFMQAILLGNGEDENPFMQYCVPVTDGRADGEKWWVCWVVDKTCPGFWGMSTGNMEGNVVEYPFVV